MNANMSELVAQAAQLVAEEGLDFAQAKRRAAEQLGAGRRLSWPDNQALEDAVFEHLRVFHADTQPNELLALRQTALAWMNRLQAFRPHLFGAVWRGTATRLSVIHLKLFCDDPKSAQWFVLDMGVPCEPLPILTAQEPASQGLMLWVTCQGLNQEVPLCLHILDRDDDRGGLKPDAKGLTRMGSFQHLQRLMESQP